MSYTEEELEAAWNSTMGDEWADWERVGVDARARYTIFANALIAKREGEPIDAKDIRIGDEIEVDADQDAYRVRNVSTGIVGRISGGCFYTEENGYLGNIDEKATFRLIHRPAPQLPTERPAVILATEVRGEIGEWWLILTPNGEWGVTGAPINGFYAVAPKHITEWKPADFVVREEGS